MAVPHHRVVELDANNGRTTGSGWLVGPRLVLTARHVVESSLPRSSPPPPQSRLTSSWIARQTLEETVRVRLLSNPGQPLMSAAVVWWHSELDVALLLCTAPQWPSAPGPIMTRWSGLSETTECEAIGFPALRASPNKQTGAIRRDSQQIGATIRPGTLVKAGQWVVELSKAPAAHNSPDTWGGYSGAALIADGILVGVLSSDAEFGNPQGRELIAVQAVRFAEDPDLIAWIAADAGPAAWVVSADQPRQASRATEAGDRPHPEQLLQVGAIPPQSASFQPRHDIMESLRDHLASSQGLRTTSLLTGGPGNGKTQIAAEFARDRRNRGELDVLLWVDARSRDSVILRYASAARRLEPEAHSGSSDAEAATAFLSWAQTTRRRWLVVLDDVPDASAIRDLWPEGAGGQVVATTQRSDAALTAGRGVIAVERFSRDEAVEYISTRAPGCVEKDAIHLADMLEYLPLALTQATSYMADLGIDAPTYIALFEQRRLELMLPADTVDDPAKTVTATLSLAMERADRIEPKGAATELLRLLSVLAPVIPAALVRDLAHTRISSQLESPTSAKSKPGIETGHLEAIQILRRAGLISQFSEGNAEQDAYFRVHSLVQRSVRDADDDSARADLVRTAAATLYRSWPSNAGEQSVRTLTQVLIDNVAALRSIDSSGALWTSEGHPVLWLPSTSLLKSGLPAASMRETESLLAESRTRLGEDHPDTLSCRSNLAAAYQLNGRTSEAVALLEQNRVHCERILGAGHPGTLANLANLAAAYLENGRARDSIELGEYVLKESVRANGSRHRETLARAGNLSAAYLADAKFDEASRLGRKVLERSEETLGGDDPDTIRARSALANVYRAVGRLSDAVKLYERVLADRERILGPLHIETLGARSNLGAAYYEMGGANESISIQEEALATAEQVLGPAHPRSLSCGHNLAVAYEAGGRTSEALALHERVHEARISILGKHALSTLISQRYLNNLRLKVGMLGEDGAIPLLTHSLAEFEDAVGTDHPETVPSRHDLAAAYEKIGDFQTAIPLHVQNLSIKERAVGPDHPRALDSRDRLAFAYIEAGNPLLAVPLLSRTLATCRAVYGDAHEFTIASMHNLAVALDRAGEPGQANALYAEAGTLTDDPQ